MRYDKIFTYLLMNVIQVHAGYLYLITWDLDINGFSSLEH